MTEYKTVAKTATAEFTEQRSRFIGTVKPISSEADALAFIAETKQKYWDARHNVYAYILKDGNISRFSDDGEPHSTAGLPALETMQKMGVTDCALVVTRYFGGILLGTGGLVRSYSASARRAVEAAGIAAMRPCTVMSFVCEYSDYGKVETLLKRHGAAEITPEFAEKITVNFSLPDINREKFTADLTETFFGKVSLQYVSAKYMPFLLPCGEA